MYGWHGRILRVNLTNGTTREETFSEEESKKYFGGRGLAIKVLLEGMDPTAGPLSPENLLVMATGPLTSTPAPTGNRYMVVTKSPLTGALSNSISTRTPFCRLCASSSGIPNATRAPCSITPTLPHSF